MENYKDEQLHPEPHHPEVSTTAPWVSFPPVILHVYLDMGMSSLQDGDSTVERFAYRF